MTSMSGSFSGKIGAQTLLSLSDQPNHEMGLAEVSGVQKSADENWNNASVRYWAVTEISKGQGTQRGYYDNVRPSGDRDYGTFEGRVTTNNGLMTVEGTWKVTDGTGKFKGASANGTFRTRMTSATDVECAWEGSYELAAVRGAS